MTNFPKKENGITVVLVLVFGFIFLILLSTVLNFVLLQTKEAKKKLAWNESLDIAEAGINYYRWCLNHDIGDSCSLSKEYFDPSGKSLGDFSLSVTTTTSCGENVSKEIVSTGWTNKFPDVKRKISVLYAKTSVAKYAYLLNDSVWAGSDREIRGLYHSNGGIRMDGENKSLVTSATPDWKWVCTDSFGCDPCPTSDGCWIENSKCLCPGVFTTTGNSNPDLFTSSTSFDFPGITIDLAKIKSQAEANSTYLPPSTDVDPNGKGYHIVFKEDGKIDVRIITHLLRDWAYSQEEGWHYDYFRIGDEYSYTTLSLDSSCPVVFVEDNIWPEGKVKGKITVASANLIDANKDTSTILRGNIEYTTTDGSDGLTLIGEKNVLIAPDAPDNMELYGIYVAQKGHFGMNLYWGNTKSKLEMTGSIVSNSRVGTQWSSGSLIVGGYLKRENYIDSKLIYDPPPFTPYAEPQYNILNWREAK